MRSLLSIGRITTSFTRPQYLLPTRPSASALQRFVAKALVPAFRAVPNKQDIYTPATFSSIASPFHIQQQQDIMSGDGGLNPEEFFQNGGAVTVTRLMQHQDANLAGNVHGGRILQIMEEAGYIAATRHTRSTFTVTGSIDHTDFLGPMHIGEIANAHCRVTHTSDRSIEVEVHVQAENLQTGSKRWTNRAFLSYVAIDKQADGSYATANIPQLEPSSTEAKALFEAGRIRYERRKTLRAQMKNHASNLQPFPSHKTVSEFLVPMGPNHGSPATGVVYGGVIMKLIDEVAGMAAWRHCHTNVVTASLDDMIFHNTVRVGNLLRLQSKVEFTSRRSMDIAVVVSCEDLRTGTVVFTGESRLVFVSLDDKGRPQDVPALTITEDWQQTAFDAGKARYEARKAARQAEAAAKRAKTA